MDTVRIIVGGPSPLNRLFLVSRSMVRWREIVFWRKGPSGNRPSSSSSTSISFACRMTVVSLAAWDDTVASAAAIFVVVVTTRASSSFFSSCTSRGSSKTKRPFMFSRYRMKRRSSLTIAGSSWYKMTLPAHVIRSMLGSTLDPISIPDSKWMHEGSFLRTSKPGVRFTTPFWYDTKMASKPSPTSLPLRSGYDANFSWSR
mmetsp:Transcript_24667/g.57917  ORF Transcript_24667/g.57917 Transcript_24667/m.57917 type:complete len:201 (-) Transcript_24667:1063-1665(-)